VVVFQAPQFTRERYEQTVLKITDGKSRVESPADWPVEGLLAHAAGESQSGFRVVDVWESEEAFARFGERTRPGPRRARCRRRAGGLSGAHVRFGLTAGKGG
jgi:hypothetical protein